MLHVNFIRFVFETRRDRDGNLNVCKSRWIKISPKKRSNRQQHSRCHFVFTSDFIRTTCSLYLRDKNEQNLTPIRRETELIFCFAERNGRVLHFADRLHPREKQI